MAVVTEYFVFCHLPKCGGKFVRYVLEQLNIPHNDVGDYHASYNRIKNLISNSLFSVTNIRHPLTWYQSRWHHRIRLGWEPLAVEDWNCASNDFNQFVLNMIKYDNDGRLSTIIKSFDDGKNGCADFVLKQESLTKDLYILLKKFYQFSDKIYWSLKPQNTSGDINNITASEIAIYDTSVLNNMLLTESYVINKYYYGLSDPNNLIDSQPIL